MDPYGTKESHIGNVETWKIFLSATTKLRSLVAEQGHLAKNLADMIFAF